LWQILKNVKAKNKKLKTYALSLLPDLGPLRLETIAANSTEKPEKITHHQNTGSKSGNKER
jgi:hypothetical protein